MLAVDANVIVRLITDDDPAQARRAARLFEGNEVQVTRTVLLETVHVLNASYGFRNGRVLDAIEKIAAREGCDLDELYSYIDHKKEKGVSRTTAIRDFALRYFMEAGTKAGHRNAGHGRLISRRERRMRQARAQD